MPSPEREFEVVVWGATGFTLLERLQANAGLGFRIEPD